MSNITTKSLCKVFQLMPLCFIITTGQIMYLNRVMLAKTPERDDSETCRRTAKFRERQAYRNISNSQQQTSYQYSKEKAYMSSFQQYYMIKIQNVKKQENIC